MSGPLSLNAEHLWNNQEVFSLSVFVAGMAEVTASQPAVVKSPNTFDQVIASNRQTVLVNHFRPGVAHRLLTASRGEGMKYHREWTKPQSVTVENWLAQEIVQPRSSCPMICRWLAKLRLKCNPWKKTNMQWKNFPTRPCGMICPPACVSVSLCLRHNFANSCFCLMNTLQFITPP